MHGALNKNTSLGLSSSLDLYKEIVTQYSFNMLWYGNLV